MGSAVNILDGDAGDDLVKDAGEMINNFLDTRFTGLTPEMRLVLAEVCLEMFERGATWADNCAGRDVSPIITEV